MRKRIRTLVALIVVCATVAAMFAFRIEAAAPDAAAVYGSNHWIELHRWDFNGNVVDSVGGAVAKPTTTGITFQEPTYKDGKIILTGNTVYEFEQPLTFPAGSLRIDVKGKFDFSNAAGNGAHRIFGLNTGSKMAGLNYINIAGEQYKGYSVALSTDSTAWNSFVLFPDKSQYNMEEEHLLTFIYYQGYLLYYMDGELMCPVTANNQGGAFIFTDFLGCNYVQTRANNTSGEIDYITITTYDESKEQLTDIYPNETAAKVYAASDWNELHRWDFNGDVTDSVGGAVAKPCTTAVTFVEPEYKDGRIILNGNSVYQFESPLTFPAGGLRIDVKGKFNFSTSTKGAHRIFGLSTDSKMSGLNLINQAGSGYGNYAVALSTTSTAWGSFISDCDKAFNMEKEHLLTFIYNNGMLYYYMDGYLMAPAKANNQGGAFKFTDFLGCGYVDNSTAYNTFGEIDYISIKSNAASVQRFASITAEGGYYAAAEGETATAGAVSFTAKFNPAALGNATEVGIYVFQSGVKDPVKYSAKVAADKLTADGNEGYFRVIIDNIAPENMEKDICAVPYVIYGTDTVVSAVGELTATASASDFADHWLGNN